MITAGEFLERFRAREWVLDVMLFWFMYLTWDVVHWYEALPHPDGAQSFLVSAVLGLLTVIFGVYVQFRSRAS